MYDSTFQDCIMAASQVPFLDIVKSQTVQQNNFLNDSSMQKIIILSAGFYFCAFWNSIKVSAGSDIEFWHVYSPRLKYADILPKLNAFTFCITLFHFYKMCVIPLAFSPLANVHQLPHPAQRHFRPQWRLDILNNSTFLKNKKRLDALNNFANFL